MIIPNAIPEPGFTMYGTVRDIRGSRIVTGIIEWTIQDRSTGESVSLKTALANLDGELSYGLTVPFETRTVGTLSFPKTSGVLPLRDEPSSFSRLLVSLNGSPLRMSVDTNFSFGPLDRGRSERVDLTLQNSNPRIAGLVDLTLEEGTSGQVLQFTISDLETPANSLIPSIASSNLFLLPLENIQLGGSGTNRTLAIRPASNQSGSSLVTLTIRDGLGGTAELSFLVVVLPQPHIKSVSLVGNALTFCWNSVTGRVFRLEFTSSIESGVWQLVREETALGTETCADEPLSPDQRRFFRVVRAR